MHWPLVLEDFGPELIYIKGENNVVADALYCLEMRDNKEILNIYELYGYNFLDLPDSVYPFFSTILPKHRKLMLNSTKR